MSVVQSDFAPFLLTVHIDVDLEVEDLFNRWYSEVHLKEIVEVPGIRWGYRYRLVRNEVFSPGESDQRYLAVYGLDREDVLLSEDFEKASGAQKPTRGWHPDVADHLANKRINVFKLISGWRSE